MKLIGECGTDLSAWPNAEHFTSWPCSAAGQQDLGGQSPFDANVIRQQSRRAAEAGCSKPSVLPDGAAFYRRLSARYKAVTATVRKIATLFYNTLRHGINYADPGYRITRTDIAPVLANLRRFQSEAFGYMLHEMPASV